MPVPLQALEPHRRHARNIDVAHAPGECGDADGENFDPGLERLGTVGTLRALEHLLGELLVGICARRYLAGRERVGAVPSVGGGAVTEEMICFGSSAAAGACGNATASSASQVHGNPRCIGCLLFIR